MSSIHKGVIPHNPFSILCELSVRFFYGLFLILLVPEPCLAQEQVVVSSPDEKYRNCSIPRWLQENGWHRKSAEKHDSNPAIRRIRMVVFPEFMRNYKPQQASDNYACQWVEYNFSYDEAFQNILSRGTV